MNSRILRRRTVLHTLSASAAGLALPVLDALGYTPGAPSGQVVALSATYALLPSALKLVAGLVLLLAPLPPDDRPVEAPR